MTIDELNALTALTAGDEFPVWDSEESGEPTKKITAQNMTASVKTLGSLVNTSEMNNALAGKQNTLTFDTTPTTGSTNPVTSGGIKTAIAQSTAKVDKYNGYTTNIVQIWNQGFLSRGNATVQYFDGAIYISVTGITTKTSTQDWILKLKGAYCPKDGLYFKYHSGQTEKSCYVNTDGYLFLQGGLNTTSSVALSISFAV